jgi:transcription initiation factor IIE alpha subunit
MSEFTCRNGHVLNPGEFECPICGAHLGHMDGESSAEIRRRDDIEDNDA